MRLSHDAVILSATDLANSLACSRLAALDLNAALGELERPFRSDPLADLLRDRGRDHEKAYVAWLTDKGLDVVDFRSVDDPEQAVAATLAAMREGRGVIVQGALREGRWFGRPDVLLRTPRPGKEPWSYEAVDTKLARETRGSTVLQLGLYSELIGAIQGASPERFHVVTPRSGPAGESYRVTDYAAFVRQARRKLESFLELGPSEVITRSYPEPVHHCDVCAWFQRCDSQRRADDHLSFVASISRSQRHELVDRGFPTLTRLAAAVTFDFKPRRGAVGTLLRSRDQASVQFESRGLPVPLHRFRDAADGHGLARLPEPSPNDVFLDLEGDPFAGEGGREYLFGLVSLASGGRPEYRAFWATTPAEEREAFIGAIDFIDAKRIADPGMHVYHYAPYEPSAFGRLMGRHATHETEVDALFRGGHFIDLYAVVRQSLIAGVERYSIKNLESLYGYKRAVPLASARDGLHAVERCLEAGMGGIPIEARDVVQGYNADDCLSTLALRDWLEGLRAAELKRGTSIPRPTLADSKPPDKVDARSKRVAELREALLVGVPSERSLRSAEQHARFLLAYMLDWHRREDKAAWWEYFRLRDLPEEELLEERQAVSGLEFVGTVSEGRNQKGRPTGAVIDRYVYPQQEMEMRIGDELKTRDGAFGDLVALDRRAGTIDVSKKSGQRFLHPSSAFAHTVIASQAMEGALARIAEAVIADGALASDPSRPHAAARGLLLAEPPRLFSGAFPRIVNEEPIDVARRVVHELDHSVLAIQGPPGAGKTYAGARMIRDLVARGRRVGVVATSHKVVLNLLKAVRGEGDDAANIPVAHKGTEDDLAGAHPDIVVLESNRDALEWVRSGPSRVLGGTAWMWAREEFAGSVDVLFVDEAAQMSLANAVAASQAATNLVLLGDPQQLEQPKKGSHPAGVEASALGHVLGEHLTMPEERGLFLPVTWRLAPNIASFTSEVFYEGRLRSRPGLENQVLSGAALAGLVGAGLWLLEVEHDGNRSSSEEEIEAVVSLVGRLTNGSATWTNGKGQTAWITGADILIVAPYNAQVSRLEERLRTTGARVGTVDKFQGQEAAVVIYSMTTSRPEDAPRGLEFLYSLNRLNVATSRARCAAILVASPRLFEAECRTPQQIKLVNALCRFREMATRI